MKQNYKDFEKRGRILEFVSIIVVSIFLLLLTRLETQLFALSESLAQHREFVSTLVYFTLINLNVVLTLLLGFLIFRNIVKLVVERRRGVIGSKLRTKLVISLVFFALAPTVLMFYISMRFVTTSFEEWFSEKVQAVMQQTREAGTLVYKQDQRRMESLARIALQYIDIRSSDDPLWNEKVEVDGSRLQNFEARYGLYSIGVFDREGRLQWKNGSRVALKNEQPDAIVVKSVARFNKEGPLSSFATVEVEDNQDAVKGLVPVVDPIFGNVIGVVMAVERFETQILKSVEMILADFAGLRPGAQLIRLSYLILMGVMVLLITFSATWMGFYVARGITGPLQSLAEATKEVALGNYDVGLMAVTDDETGQLVRSFNSMTHDLKEHRTVAEKTQANLRQTNEELDQRRQYMEIILKNITGGVISLDADNNITTFNNAAEQLLGLPGQELIGRSVLSALGDHLVHDFWKPIEKSLQLGRHFNGPIEIKSGENDFILMADASRIRDEHDVEVGTIIVFDDMSVVARVQRVAAWKEVARRIAHEIKNPITPIKLNAERLMRRYQSRFEGDDKVVFESCVQTIIHQVDSLRDLVNEFSKFTRMPNLKIELICLKSLIEEALDMFRMSYPSLEIDTSGIVSLPDLPLDKEQMKRVFVNLMTNSIAAFVQGRQGKIKIKAELIEKLDIVRIEFSDNGSGIPKELWNRVLEPYFSTKREGTGLGLAIVNQIISDHGGYLRLGGNEPYGATVVIELPVVQKDKRLSMV